MRYRLCLLTFLLVLCSGLHTLQAEKYTILKDDSIPGPIKDWLTEELKEYSNITPCEPNVFFTPGTLRLIGYIKGYDPESETKSGYINNMNDVTFEQYPVMVEIQPDGRFEADVLLLYPKLVSIYFKASYISFYGEPSQIACLIMDWEDFISEDRDFRTPYISTQFDGPLAEINRELADTHLSQIEVSIYQESLASGDYNRLKKAISDNLQQQKENLLSLAGKGRLSSQSLSILSSRAELDAATTLLNFSEYREQKKEGETDEHRPDDYYDFLQTFNWNDYKKVIPYNFLFFINRLGYLPSIREPEDICKNENGYVARQTIKEWQRRDSLLLHTLGIPTSFFSEAARLQDLNRVIYQSCPKEEALIINDYIQTSFSHPFLKSEAQRVFDITYNKQDEGYELTEGPATATFRKIIDPYKGKYLLVDFWATTCGGCLKTIKKMKDTRERLKGHPDMEFIFITDDFLSPQTSYDKWVKEQELHHTFRLTEEEYKQLRVLFRFIGNPHYLLIDPEGRILNDNYNPENFEEDVKNLQD